MRSDNTQAAWWDRYLASERLFAERWAEGDMESAEGWATLAAYQLDRVKDFAEGR